MVHSTRSWSSAVRELGLIALVYLVYRTGRLATAGSVPAADAHAKWVHHLERSLRFRSEASIQAAIHSPHVFEAANLYYVSGHFPISVGFLVWGFLVRPRAEYQWARNLMVLVTLTAVAIHMAFPLAPPRMFSQYGFVDTMTLYGPSAYDGASGAMANQYAAMPSLHVGWAVLIAVVVGRTGPRLLRYLAALHALATFAVVTVTANHWFLDAVVAMILVGLALIVLPAPGRVRNPLRRPAVSGGDNPDRPSAVPTAIRSLPVPVFGHRAASEPIDRAAS